MRDYNYREKWQKLLTPEIVKKLTLIHEYKGEQRLFIEAHKDELNELIEIAKVLSTEASNRIEGISTADDRLKNLVQAKTTPRNRDESEIAGYRDVLNTIHESYDYIPINANYILQLHRDLYKFLGSVDGGIFKNYKNIIRETDMDGNERIRFKPVAAWETPPSIDELCKAFYEAKDEVELLLLDFMFILDFLCIHPFSDGNGRVSRLLSLFLLYKSGYDVGKYVSFEEQINESKDFYYEALQESSIGWHTNENSYFDYMKNFLSMLYKCYKELDKRFSTVNGKKLKKTERVEQTVLNSVLPVSKAEICDILPDVSPSTVEAVLGKMVKTGSVMKLGQARATKYVNAKYIK